MRDIVEALRTRVENLLDRSIELIDSVSPDDRFRRPEQFEDNFEMFSCGEFVLRSAGALEQCFSGITTRLWDDPFEWTLQEHMSSPDRFREYLEEVSKTCERGFAFIASDDDLRRRIPAPRELKAILEVVIEAIERAAFFLGKAHAVMQLLSHERSRALNK